jgi:hypothetical protein
LLAFFELCKNDDFANTLLYSEVPFHFVWHKSKFIRKKLWKGWPGVKKDNALGRVYTIHPNNTVCYYLRLLLNEVRGPKSFSDIKTVNGVLLRTFQAACKALGLLEDDKHWDNTVEEAALCNSPYKLRELFTVLLMFCQLFVESFNKFQITNIGICITLLAAKSTKFSFWSFFYINF